MTTPAMEFLAAHAFPELGAAVRDSIEQTICAWESAVRRVLPTADRLTMDQLRDDLPEVLLEVSRALVVANPYVVETLTATAPSHGAVRYDQGFKLNEVFVEYSILRSILVEQAAAKLQRDLGVGEIMGLGAALDVTLRRAVGRFVDHLSSQLQSASEAQSKYLSFLSHDLRGGLNGVFLMIEVLKREMAGEARMSETLQDLDVMRRSLMDTISTMDRFLHAERFRKGKVQVNPTEVVLHSVLSDAAAHYAYQAKDKQVEFRVEAEGDSTVISDKEMLNLIIQNLLSNALKFTHAGTRVTLWAQCDSNKCLIKISDQGPGISEDKLEEVFSAFSRGETHGRPGVGLGLYIARQAAANLRAKLWVESKVGEGATFFVEFPKVLTT